MALDVPMRGPVAAVAVVCVLGALSFVGLGLLVAARPRTIEGVSGLMNFVMFPMWIFSGVFFSNERFPAALQPFIRGRSHDRGVQARRLPDEPCGLRASG